MTLRDLLMKKKTKNDKEKDKTNSTTHTSEELEPTAHIPEFTIIRSDTNTHEIISPPSFASDIASSSDKAAGVPTRRFSSLHNTSNSLTRSRIPTGERRLSSILHLRSASYESRASANLPADLPNIEDGLEGSEDREAQWEKRATILAQKHRKFEQSTFPNDTIAIGARQSEGRQHPHEQPPVTGRQISNIKGDDDLQQAIRLHEAGDLSSSTAMFGRLAEPNGENNALAQVLYGLALRHGWGISPNPSLAITYLSRAASNSASVESQALASGIKEGGAAKGELVLAIYELANCFRHGWGVEKDPIAARSYYETAANLGDTDAMNEVAKCYEEGFGGKKDKFKAAAYYRAAEEKGNKILGNSWIWKEKYDQKNPKASQN